MPFLRQLEKKAYHKITLKGGDTMTNFLRNEINEIIETTNNKLIYALMIDRFNQYKKKGIIDEAMYNYIERKLRKKYLTKK